MVVSKLKQVKGRKVYMESVTEDKNGTKLVTADALLMETRAKL